MLEILPSHFQGTSYSWQDIFSRVSGHVLLGVTALASGTDIVCVELEVPQEESFNINYYTRIYTFGSLRKSAA